MAAAGIPDRFKAAFAAIVRAMVGNNIVGARVDYTAGYQARVVVQNADGSLDLRPDEARLPDFQNVPIRYGVPGVTATVASGARVLLEWAGADPQRPIATVWESASVSLLTVTASAIKLGSSAATQPLVLGTTYAAQCTALATAATSLASAMTPLLLPPAAAAAATAATAIATAATALAAAISARNTTL